MCRRHKHHPRPPKPPVPPTPPPVPTPPPSTLKVAWSNTDPAIADSLVQLWVDGLNAQVADIQALWPHVQECSHVFVPKGQTSPAGAVPAILEPRLPEAPGALGYHDNDGNGHASIFIGTQTSLAAGVSISSVMSHEACELTVDPSCTLTATAPNGDVWALEVGDPVESDSYTVVTPGGTVQVSDFVGAAFFGMATGKLDHSLVASRAFTVAPGGYAIVNGAAIYGEGTPHVSDPDDLPHPPPKSHVSPQGATVSTLSQYSKFIAAALTALVAVVAIVFGADSVVALAVAAAVAPFAVLLAPANN